MRIILSFTLQNSLPSKLCLRARLIGPLGLLIAAATIFASGGASYQAPIDRHFTQIKKLTASDGAKFSLFGSSVAIYGNTAIVGADNPAYIFERDKGGADNWGEVKKLIVSDGLVMGGCNSVAIYGNTVIVGADGAAYIFERNKGGANNWGMVKKLTAPDVASYATFGDSVAIYKDTAVVGATVSDPENEKNGPGAAYIFERNKGGANNWGKVRKLTGSDRSKDDVYDEFGDSVAIYERTVIVGAYGNPAWSDSEGAAYIFERDKGGADNWGEVKKLAASDGEDAGFGCSVAIYGNTAIVGGGGNWDRDTDDKGAAYIFERSNGGANNWGRSKKLLPSERAARDGFGDSVAIFADRAIIGAPGQALKDGKFSAYIFERNNGGANNWGEGRRLTGSASDEGDRFGISAAIYEDTAIVGATEDVVGNDRLQGSASIFSPKTVRR